MSLLKMASAACAIADVIRLPGVARARLGRNFRAYHDERTGRRAPCAGDGSLIDEGHRAPSRTTICDDKHFILVALRSACGRLAVRTGHTDGAVTCDCRRRARRPRRTFRSLRPGRPWWPGRPCWPGITLFPRRLGGARITFRARRALSTARHANSNANRNGDTFDMMHAHTSAATKAHPIRLHAVEAIGRRRARSTTSDGSPSGRDGNCDAVRGDRDGSVYCQGRWARPSWLDSAQVAVRSPRLSRHRPAGRLGRFNPVRFRTIQNRPKDAGGGCGHTQPVKRRCSTSHQRPKGERS
jgi:hypothetical protein